MRTLVRRAAVSALAAIGLVTLTLVVVPAAPAGAVVRGPAPPSTNPRISSNTQMTLTGLGPGQNVTGFIADPTNPFDPVLDGYPTSDPTTGFTPKDEGFAGVIQGTPVGGGATLNLYCFDINTDTYIGFGYVLGTWDAATVPNVGYVAQVLNNYYPFVPTEPSGLGNTSEMAAAVQAAIWFFSDRYVLSTSDPLHDVVAAIVANIIKLGPVPAPLAPSLTITPTIASGADTNAIVGPFTVTSLPASATVTVYATGATMYSNAAATTPIAPNATVPSGTQIWLRSSGTTSAVLQATALSTVPKDNVWLYDQGVDDAQKLILAEDTTLTTTASAEAEFMPVGSLVVTKAIEGPAVRHQGQVTIHTVCGGVPLSPDLVVASGTPAGTFSRTYTGIAPGTRCTVTETVLGNTNAVYVIPIGPIEQVVEILPGVTVPAYFVDQYFFAPGSLIVSKSIQGGAAGLQGQIRLHAVCLDNGLPTLNVDFFIAANATGEHSTQYNDIPAGSICRITEPNAGEVPPTVAPPVTVLPGSVTIPAGGGAQADVTDTYNFVPGTLTVTKSITGTPAPGVPITITTTCEGPEGTVTLSPAINIPPGPDSETYTAPGNSLCTADENPNGSSDLISVEQGGDPQATVPAGGTAAINLTNTYTTGLTINKTIEGPAAGKQDAIVIDVSCTTAAGAPVTLATSTITIAANHAAGTVSTLEGPITAGSTCTATETSDGSTSTVAVAVSPGRSQMVTVPTGGDAATIDFTNTYTFVPASLVITKNIAGPDAGKQGAVTIQANCSDPNGNLADPVSFTVPALAAAGAHPHTFDVAAGSTCTIVETDDGSSPTVDVSTTGSPQTLTVPLSGATATITDTYTPADGAIFLAKILGGPFAGQQGPITIAATCGTTALPDFVIPAGTPAGVQTHFYANVPGGSSCTLTETADGATAIVTTTVYPDNMQTVTVAPATVVPVVFADVFTDSPGTLTVTKNITGTEAGKEGEIAILVDCGEAADQFAFTIPAGTPAGSVSRTFDNIPAGSTCTITETSNGSTSSVAVTTAGSGQSVAINPDQTATAVLTDSYDPIVLTGLAFTGSAVAHLAELGAAAVFAGSLLVAAGGRRRFLRRHDRGIDD
jgi:hypothetical protein